jgi:hypothetical protein
VSLRIILRQVDWQFTIFAICFDDSPGFGDERMQQVIGIPLTVIIDVRHSSENGGLGLHAAQKSASADSATCGMRP